MNRFSTFRALFLAGILFLGISSISCSKKSGCPAEDVHVKTDKDGNFKVGKTQSGLLPPKASKNRKNR